MAFVSIGDSSSRPTYFELIAAGNLMPSLKAATIYSLSVFAQRRTSLHRLLDYEDELFALISALLDRQSLAAGSASFADGLYGLRRAPYRPAATKEGERQAPLSQAQQRLTLLYLVGLPYIKAKLDKLFHRHRRSVEGVLGLPSLPPPEEDAPDGLPRRLQRVAISLFLRVYPFVHATWEGARFAYQLAYLLDYSPFYAPGLHLLRQHIVRVSGMEMVESERATRQRREGQLARSRERFPAALAPVTGAAMRAGHAFADHTRNALILSVFAFKVLEWWYTSGEERLAAQKVLPVPAPPPPLLPHPEGIPLPRNITTCPICGRARTNPAVAIASGYTFCYPCIFTYVASHGCCPVTRIPTTVERIRRLYQSA